MLKIKSILKKPLLWLSIFLLLLSYIIHFRNEVKWQNFVFSDGEGYYAYLPALFLNHDPSFEKTIQAKQTFYADKLNFFYAFKTKDGKVVNKYFPGVALMQTPSFLATTAVLKVFGKETNGYSKGYMISFLLTAFLFLMLGIQFLMKSLNLDVSSTRKQQWLAFLAIFFGTNLFFSTLNYPSFSHIYSFFLFGMLLFQFQKYLLSKEQKRLYFIGITLAFIFLVRPTNLIFLAFLLFFFDSWKSFVVFLKELFLSKEWRFLNVLVPFLLFISLWFILNKWQTGSFVYWSYQGEGFNFANPKLLETWFSYRIGIFVHHPILLLALFGLIYLFRENKFKFVVWLLYFFALSYLISSWWCWDYESTFGHRGFSEHFIIFIFPLLSLLKQVKKINLVYGFIVLSLLYTGMRFYQRVMQIFPRQKFTQETFWKSMFDFDDSLTDKYLTRTHCEPFGKIKKSTLVFENKATFEFDETKEFGLDTSFDFPQERLNNRFFLEIEFEKQLLGNNWKDIFLVADSQSEKDSSRFYFPQDIYEDYQEGKNGSWVKTKCQEEIPVSFSAKEKVAIYFWNLGKKKFKIRNLKVKMYEYVAK